jgi:hypothetical protein
LGENALPKFRNLALWILIALLVVLLFNLFQGSSSRTTPPPLSYTQFRQEVLSGDIRKVTVMDDQVRGVRTDDSQFTTTIPLNDPSLWALLNDHHVATTLEKADDGIPMLLSILINWFPMLLLIAVWVFFLRRVPCRTAPDGAQRAELNWRKGLLRSWIILSILWLAIWVSMIWGSCQTVDASGSAGGAAHEEYFCWLGFIHLPGFPPELTAPLGSFTVWTWAMLVGEGLAVPAALLALGYAILWARDGFQNGN